MIIEIDMAFFFPPFLRSYVEAADALTSFIPFRLNCARIRLGNQTTFSFSDKLRAQFCSSSLPWFAPLAAIAKQPFPFEVARFDEPWRWKAFSFRLFPVNMAEFFFTFRTAEETSFSFKPVRLG